MIVCLHHLEKKEKQKCVCAYQRGGVLPLCIMGCVHFVHTHLKGGILEQQKCKQE